jgi:hypothetical protein
MGKYCSYHGPMGAARSRDAEEFFDSDGVFNVARLGGAG